MAGIVSKELRGLKCLLRFHLKTGVALLEAAG